MRNICSLFGKFCLQPFADFLPFLNMSVLGIRKKLLENSKLVKWRGLHLMWEDNLNTFKSMFIDLEFS